MNNLASKPQSISHLKTLFFLFFNLLYPYFTDLTFYYVYTSQLYSCEVWRCNLSREYWRKIKQIQKRFITYNLKIKRNIPYHILLLEVRISPLKKMAISRYLMYMHNAGEYKLPKISLNSIQIT